MKIFIKNMVCVRCEMVVKAELEKLGLQYNSVELGEAEIMEEISETQFKILDLSLRESGLELMNDRNTILAERIKTTVIELIHHNDQQLKINLSDYLSEKLNHNYTYLSNLFSKAKGTTIEKYYLAHKIERVKELLVYDELNLTEIAYKMHYSSVAHLSNQFKKITGLTPTDFRKLRHIGRNVLSDL
ncbi:MAG: helix-turn-helix transcriptional regulator [Bacteroidales bacterium]|nr:helix-turn-helix transcriptional regulator [Bacteroidales bacterium]